LFHWNETIVDLPHFRREFEADSLVRRHQFLVERNRTREPIGLTFAHSCSDELRECTLNVFLTEAVEGRGYAVDVCALMFRHLLRSAGFARVFVEVFEFNLLSLATIRSAGIQEVARLPAHRVHGDRRFDVIRFVADAEFLPLADDWYGRLAAHRR
jgi:RimJ/RimL family protein N-acetyltransferase